MGHVISAWMNRCKTSPSDQNRCFLRAVTPARPLFSGLAVALTVWHQKIHDPNGYLVILCENVLESHSTQVNHFNQIKSSNSIRKKSVTVVLSSDNYSKLSHSERSESESERSTESSDSSSWHFLVSGQPALEATKLCNFAKYQQKACSKRLKPLQ